MKYFKIISILVLCITVNSCKMIYQLKQKELQWQPYKLGDELIFKSSKGMYDTLYVKNIFFSRYRADPLDLFADYNHYLGVNLAKNDKGRTSSISLNKYRNGSNMKFDFIIGDDYFLKYPTFSMNIDSLERKQIITDNRFGKNIPYLKLKTEQTPDNLKKFSFEMIYIYWSKEFGYLELEFIDGYNWKLISFKRDGKIIYQNE